MSTSNTVLCTRCGTESARMAFQPFNNELGKRAFAEICQACWAAWLKTQQQLINHYALDLREPKSKQFLFGNMEQFLFSGGTSPFGEGTATPPIPIG